MLVGRRVGRREKRKVGRVKKVEGRVKSNGRSLSEEVITKMTREGGEGKEKKGVRQVKVADEEGKEKEK